jgi:lysophospholipase L1-like esterase
MSSGARDARKTGDLERPPVTPLQVPGAAKPLRSRGPSTRHAFGLLGPLVALLGACGSAGHGSADSDLGPDAGTRPPVEPPASDAEAGGDATSDDAEEGIDAVSSTDAGDDQDVPVSDAGGGYDPCPPKGTACAIMPLGDSITDGTAGSSIGGGYRVSLFHRALGDHKTITFVGSGSDGPATVDGVPFPPHHEGHSGFVIGGPGDPFSAFIGIAPLVVNALDTYHPNIVALMIGTNDMNLADDVANAPTRLAALIDSVTSTDPKLLLVVAQIIPSQTDALNTSIQAYNAAIPALVQARATAGKHVALVDMYDAFTAIANYKSADMSDNLHPNDAGYAVMAGVWYARIGALLR